MNLENILNKGSKILKSHNIQTYDLDAQLLLANILGIQREILITKDRVKVTKKIIKKYDSVINRRIKKEPIAYIIGKKEFWSNDFLVNRATLVPRPETELLIYKTVSFFKNKKINILDIGTGSGCILLSILMELNLARGIGIDISSNAIKIAKMNCKKLNLLNRAKFKVSDLFNYNSGKYDLIVSNPPYIPLKDIKNLSRDITNHEPMIALNGGYDGLDQIKKVIYKSSYLLKNKGLLALEIGTGQYKKVSSILRNYRFREIAKEYDNNRNVRCIMSTK